MIILQLFYEFFKIGLFSVGGGLATIPFLEELSTKTAWFTHADLADMIAVSESTPGPIGINMAVYCGYTSAGILGSIAAVLGIVAPCVIVVLIISAFLDSFRNSKYVNGALNGLRPASCALITSAGVSIVLLSLFNVELWKTSGHFLDLFNWKALILAAAIFVLTGKFKKLHPGIFLIASAVIGIVFRFAE